MGRKDRKCDAKDAKSVFYVFCEGESEEAYIGLLRQMFRQNIRLISIKSRSNISQRFVDSSLSRYRLRTGDKVFMMFDLDVPEMYGRVSAIKGCELLLSNPCLEIWFVLHYRDCTRALNSAECLDMLKKLVPNYRKGQICAMMSQQLTVSIDNAMLRTSKLRDYSNPSSTIYRLIAAIHSY